MDLFGFNPKALDARFEVKGGVIVSKGEAGPAAKPVAKPAAAPAAPASSAPAMGGAGGPSAPAAAAAGAATGPAKEYVRSELPLETRFALCRSVGEECVQEEELRALLAAKDGGAKGFPTCYDGFEPSGRMHIAQGIYKAILVNKLTASGCVFKFWVADWFALLNNKMGGDLKKIRIVGKYMIEVRNCSIQGKSRRYSDANQQTDAVRDCTLYDHVVLRTAQTSTIFLKSAD